MYVLSNGRNAGEFVIKCIESVRSQTIQPVEHLIIDDISDDNTRQILMNYLCNKNYQDLRVVFNNIRKYRLLNLYENIVDKDPEDIICIVDSDDWLAHDKVLETVKSKFDSDDKL